MTEGMPENLLASQAGIGRLALVYAKMLDDIRSFRKSKKHLPAGLSPLSDVKRGVIEALSVCSDRQMPPPRELVDLVKKLFESATDERKRIKGGIKNRDLLKKAVEMHVKTGLKGRPLAAALRTSGISAPNRTVATYCASEDFKRRVGQLKGTVLAIIVMRHGHCPSKFLSLNSRQEWKCPTFNPATPPSCCRVRT